MNTSPTTVAKTLDKALCGYQQAVHTWWSTPQYDWLSFEKVCQKYNALQDAWTQASFAEAMTGAPQPMLQQASLRVSAWLATLYTNPHYRKKLWGWVRRKSFHKLHPWQQDLIKSELASTKPVRWTKTRRGLLENYTQQHAQWSQKFANNLRRDVQHSGVHVAAEDIRRLSNHMRKMGAHAAKERGLTGAWFTPSAENFAVLENAPLARRYKHILRQERNRLGVRSHIPEENNGYVLQRLAWTWSQEARVHGKSTYGAYMFDGSGLNSSQSVRHLLERVTEHWLEMPKSKPSAQHLAAYAKLHTTFENAWSVWCRRWSSRFGLCFETTSPPNALQPKALHTVKVRQGRHLLGTLVVVGPKTTADHRSSDGQCLFWRQEGRTPAGRRIPPIVVAHVDGSSRWNHEDVITLYHELGHAVRFLAQKGIHDGCDTGLIGESAVAIEWPSLFMQMEAWSPEVLRELYGFGGVRTGTQVAAWFQQRELDSILSVAWLRYAMYQTKSWKNATPQAWAKSVETYAHSDLVLTPSMQVRCAALVNADAGLATYVWGWENAKQTWDLLQDADADTWQHFWKTRWTNTERLSEVAIYDLWKTQARRQVSSQTA